MPSDEDKIIEEREISRIIISDVHDISGDEATEACEGEKDSEEDEAKYDIPASVSPTRVCTRDSGADDPIQADGMWIMLNAIYLQEDGKFGQGFYFDPPV